jgi:hypothetical protein
MSAKNLIDLRSPFALIQFISSDEHDDYVGPLPRCNVLALHQAAPARSTASLVMVRTQTKAKARIGLDLYQLAAC